MILEIDVLYVLAVPFFALAVDLVVGDPHSLPHPVCLLGKGAHSIEKLARKTPGLMRLKGLAGMLVLALGAGGVAYGLTALPLVGIVFAAYLAYAGLALGQLLREARGVVRLLEAGNLVQARHALSMLVSRETEHLSEAEVRAGLAETLSENLNDGFVAPFFYLVLGGPALLWAYKAVSTLDSMWGYMTDEYRDFGWAAARTDDLLAWIPARLTAVFMLFVGWCMGWQTHGLWENIKTDAAKSSSPNAGWPMAAGAWLVGAAMGGPAVYFGEVKHKPILGPEERGWDGRAMRRLLSLVLFTGLALAAAMLFSVGLLRCLL